MQKTQIALFPLQVFLLPGEKTTLHIFEERYRQLIDDCENVELEFGIPFSTAGNLGNYGSLVKLSKVLHKYPNGSSDVEIECRQTFKLNQYYHRIQNKLYPGGDVTFIDHFNLPPVDNEVMEALAQYLEGVDQIEIPNLLNTKMTAYDVAHIIQLSEESKVKIVGASSHQKQNRILLENLRILLMMQKQKASIVGEIFLN